MPDDEGSAQPPGDHKLELDTPLEALVLSVGILAVAAALVLLLCAGMATRTHPAKTVLLLLAFVPVAALAAYLAFSVYRRMNNYYVVRATSRSVVYHFDCFGWTREREYLPFSRIAAMTVSGSMVENKRRRRPVYSYRLYAIDVDGGAHPLSNWAASRGGFNSRARSLAAIVGCRYVECPDEHEMIATKEADGTVSVTHTPAQELLGE